MSVFPIFAPDFKNIAKGKAHKNFFRIHAKNCVSYIKQIKCSRYRPGVTQRVGRGIALLFHDSGTRKV